MRCTAKYLRTQRAAQEPLLRRLVAKFGCSSGHGVCKHLGVAVDGRAVVTVLVAFAALIVLARGSVGHSRARTAAMATLVTLVAAVWGLFDAAAATVVSTLQTPPPPTPTLLPLTASVDCLAHALAAGGGNVSAARRKYKPCPCCGALLPSHSFLPFNRRAQAMCPVCHTLERHRAACFNLVDHGLLAPRPSGTRPTRVLHFGPEPAMVDAITASGELEHVGADFFDAKGHVPTTGRYHATTVPADIRRLTAFPSRHFDALIVLHVLEHVDRIEAALAEVARVLTRPHGRALVEVPCWREPRIRASIDCTRDDAANRTRRCGQTDHVWRFACGQFEQLLRRGGLRCHDSRAGPWRGRYATVAKRTLPRNLFPQYVCRASSNLTRSAPL